MAEEDLYTLVICILRTIVSHSKFYVEKGFDVFLGCSNPSVISLLLDGFQKNLSNIKILTETILFISSISQQDGPYLDYLKNCSELGQCIKQCLEFYANDKTSTALLTECLANLPVEEFNIII